MIQNLKVVIFFVFEDFIRCDMLQNNFETVLTLFFATLIVVISLLPVPYVREACSSNENDDEFVKVEFPRKLK